MKTQRKRHSAEAKAKVALEAIKGHKTANEKKLLIFISGGTPIVTNYCFASSEDRYVLFTEACIRGWLAAIRDFPQLKSREESTTLAQREYDSLRSEVCCIPLAKDAYSAEDAYWLLVSAAYVNTYRALEQVSEREIVVMASVLKRMPIDEALSLVRQGFSDDKGRTEIDRAYAQFLKLSNRDEGGKNP